MVGGPSDFCVSRRSKSFFFSFFGGLLFDLGACWDKDLDQGLKIKSEELLNFNVFASKKVQSVFILISNL